MLVHRDEQTSDSDNTLLERPRYRCSMGYLGSHSVSTHINIHMYTYAKVYNTSIPVKDV